MEKDNSSDLEKVRELIREKFPDMILISVSDFENEEHQSYKYLYEKIKGLYENMDEEFHSTRFSTEALEKENAVLTAKLEKQQELNRQLKDQMKSTLDSIKSFVEKEIIISDIKAVDSSGQEIILPSEQKKNISMDDLSLNPGVYGFHRPSWFTPLRTELNKLNVAKKNAQNTQGMLREKVSFWKKLFGKIEADEIKVPEAADAVDLARQKKIMDLLTSDASNEEKFIKYLLLTPGMSKDFLYTLTGAAEIGVDANTIIRLLEQPKESFNKEIIVEYVSKVHKATEYNLKRELAEELIRGEWYVVSDINGSEEKYQMVPFDVVNGIRDKLNSIYDVLSGSSVVDTVDQAVESLAEERAAEEFADDFDLPEGIEVEENMDYESDMEEELKQLI